MIKSTLAAATLTLGLATVAYANLSSSNPAALSPAGLNRSATPTGDAVRYTENRSLAPTMLSDADTRFPATRAAPRQIPLPGADAPSQGYTVTSRGGSRPTPMPSAREPSAREPVSPEPTVTSRPAFEPVREAAAPSPRGQDADRPQYRKAKWSGGEGATWKTGRDAYGFSGLIGGCRIVGAAGPRGYTLDRSC